MGILQEANWKMKSHIVAFFMIRKTWYRIKVEAINMPIIRSITLKKAMVGSENFASDNW